MKEYSMVDNSSTLDMMNKIFREQHRQMIEEQKRLLDDYKQYFDGVIQSMEAQANAMNPPPPTIKEQENVAKEIADIGKLLDDAVKTYGKELAEILPQLSARQKKQLETKTDKIN